MKIIRFILVGAMGAASNFVMFSILTYLLKIWYLASSVIAFVFALIVSFLLQKFWTFQDAKRDTIHRQAVSFSVIGISNLALNTLIIFSLVHVLHCPKIVAQILGSSIIAVGSYFYYARFIFTPSVQTPHSNL